MPMRKIVVDNNNFEYNFYIRYHVDRQRLFVRIRDYKDNNKHIMLEDGVHTPFDVANIVRKHFLGVPEISRPIKPKPEPVLKQEVKMTMNGSIYILHWRNFEDGFYHRTKTIEYHLDPNIAKERVKFLNGDIETVYQHYRQVKGTNTTNKEWYFNKYNISPDMQEKINSFDPEEAKFYFTTAEPLFDGVAVKQWV